MATPLVVPSIDLAHFAAAQSGLTAQQLSFIGTVTAAISQNSLETAFNHLSQTLPYFNTILDVSALLDVEDVISLLDAGASKVFVSREQLSSLKDARNTALDLDRVVLRIHGPAWRDAIDSISGTPVGIYAHHVGEIGQLEDLLSEYGKGEKPEVYGSFAHPSEESAMRIAKMGIIPVISASKLTVDPRGEANLIPVTNILLANARTDRTDGLFTTLVTDEREVALGIVYSSAASVAESLKSGRGVYQSRKRGLWYKGETSGDIQELIKFSLDCDQDSIRFVVRQRGRGFCHLARATCFGPYSGLARLQQTIQARRAAPPNGSYTSRLFKDPKLLNSKIMEEAKELCEAEKKEDIAFEAADLLYFALTKCIAAGIRLEDIEKNLDAKSAKVKRRKGDAKENGTKGHWSPKMAMRAAKKNKERAVPRVQTQDIPVVTTIGPQSPESSVHEANRMLMEASSIPPGEDSDAGVIDGQIKMRRIVTEEESYKAIRDALKRPAQGAKDTIMKVVEPIIRDVRDRGDEAVLEYTHKLDKATSLTSTILEKPFPPELMELPQTTMEAIDVAFENIRKFHAAQKDTKPLHVETMPGVVCSRFARPIDRVGLYVPGGTAVLVSSALMLGVPALVAGCKSLVLASPPCSDGSVMPELVYVAHKIGAECIVTAGGAQAIAAMAYGTESVPKVDKILGPGNQFVTAAKMLVANDTSCCVSIDMPAGPSEVMVIADTTANPAFVASDLLSQAEHGPDSQVICIAIGLTDAQLSAIELQVHRQAMALPRVDIVRGAIEHSTTFVVNDVKEAMQLSNEYAPEHLILQVKDAEKVITDVRNAGSVFVGTWTPESVGDYAAGVNHSLPTYGYAKQYSGVNLGSFLKHITSSKLTPAGLRNIGEATMRLARVEELEAHRRAVQIRLAHMDKLGIEQA